MVEIWFVFSYFGIEVELSAGRKLHLFMLSNLFFKSFYMHPWGGGYPISSTHNGPCSIVVSSIIDGRALIHNSSVQVLLISIKISNKITILTLI